MNENFAQKKPDADYAIGNSPGRTTAKNSTEEQIVSLPLVFPPQPTGHLLKQNGGLMPSRSDPCTPHSITPRLPNTTLPNTTLPNTTLPNTTLPIKTLHLATRLPGRHSQRPAKPALFDAVHRRFSTQKPSLSRHCQRPVPPNSNCDLNNLNARSKAAQVEQGEPVRIRTVFCLGNRPEHLLSSHPCSDERVPPDEAAGRRHEERPRRSSPAVLQVCSPEIRPSRRLCLAEPDLTSCDYARFTGRPVIG